MDLIPSEKQKSKVIGSRVLHAWFSAYKNVKLYKPDHPTSRENASKMASLLNSEVFRDRLGLSISNIDGLFTISDIFFIEESLGHYELLRSLEEHNIATVVLNQGISESEIIDFCNFLTKKRSPGTPEMGFQSDHIKAASESKESWSKGRLRTVESKYRGSESYVKMREHYDDWLVLAQQIFNRLLDEQIVNMTDVSDHLDQLIDEIHQNPGTLAAMLTGVSLTHLHLQHSIHTMIYSIFIGQQLSLDAGTIRTLALGGLLHDIGRWFLPADFNTGYNLKKEDTEFVRLHSRDGASYLAGVPGLPMSIVRIALEHHIGYDGKGYPDLPGQAHSHLLSQIVGIADFASWATVSDGSYHKPVAPHRLVRTLMARAGTQFDPLLVKIFIPLFGLYPPGTEVRLTSGETGVVVESNIRNISRPRVAIRNSSGAYTLEWLMKLTSKTNGSPYEKSIRGILGHVGTMELSFDLVQDH